MIATELTAEQKDAIHAALKMHSYRTHPVPDQLIERLPRDFDDVFIPNSSHYSLMAVYGVSREDARRLVALDWAEALASGALRLHDPENEIVSFPLHELTNWGEPVEASVRPNDERIAPGYTWCLPYVKDVEAYQLERNARAGDYDAAGADPYGRGATGGDGFVSKKSFGASGPGTMASAFAALPLDKLAEMTTPAADGAEEGAEPEGADKARTAPGVTADGDAGAEGAGAADARTGAAADGVAVGAATTIAANAPAGVAAGEAADGGATNGGVDAAADAPTADSAAGPEAAPAAGASPAAGGAAGSEAAPAADAPAAGDAAGSEASPTAGASPAAAGAAGPEAAPDGAPAAPSPKAAPTLVPPIALTFVEPELPPLRSAALKRMKDTDDYKRGQVPESLAAEIASFGAPFTSFVHPTAFVCKRIAELAGGGLRDYDVPRLLDRDWDFAAKNGIVRLSRNDTSSKLIFPISVLRDDGRTPVEVGFWRSRRQGGGEKPWILFFLIDFAPSEVPGGALRRWAYLGDEESLFATLAAMALPERWDFDFGFGAGSNPEAKTPRYEILRNYLAYTFYRLSTQGGVLEDFDAGVAAFNTGLVDKAYQPLYACFSPNDPEYPQRWRFEAFCKAGSRANGSWGKRLSETFDPLPPHAEYFARTSDLLFDADARIDVDGEHILLEHPERLPREFLEKELGSSQNAMNLINEAFDGEKKSDRNLAFSNLGLVVQEEHGGRLLRNLQHALNVAVEGALARARWDFHTAVPGYFATTNSLCMLLPLDLTADDRTDAVLVAQQVREGVYIGHTILTMEMAYKDARVVSRPGSDWLTPEAVIRTREGAIAAAIDIVRSSSLTFGLTLDAFDVPLSELTTAIAASRKERRKAQLAVMEGKAGAETEGVAEAAGVEGAAGAAGTVAAEGAAGAAGAKGVPAHDADGEAEDEDAAAPAE